MPPSELLDMLPPEVRRAYAAMWTEHAPGLGALRRGIASHRAEVEQAAQKNEFLDTTLSDRIASGFDALLEGWDDFGTLQRRAVATAVAYYALSEDAEDDLDSVQ